MTDENQNEVPEEEIPLVKELVPVQEPIKMMQTVDSTEDVGLAIQRIEKHVELHKKMTKLALKVTNVNDWVDQNGTPYLQASGSRKIRMCFGCTVSNVMYERTDFPTDELGAYYVIEVVGDITWNGDTIPETGTCSSRDAFFAKRKGALLPMSEVDVTNIRKKALTNFYNRAIKGILGLSFTWNEISEFTNGEITQEKCRAVKYGNKPSYNNGGGSNGKKPGASPEQEKKRNEIKQMMGDMYGKEEAPNMLEKNTTFEARDQPGKIIKGKRSVKDLSPAQIDMIHKNLTPAYKDWVDEGATVDVKDSTGTKPKNEREKPKKEKTKFNKEYQVLYDGATDQERAICDGLINLSAKKKFLDDVLPF